VLGAAEEARIDDARVEHERSGPIVGSEREAVAPTGADVIAGTDRLASPARPLPRTRPLVEQRPERRVDRERPAVRDGQALRTDVGETDVTRVRAGGDVELVFQLAALPMEDHVDPGPQLPVGDAAVSG
jgi:hypothetical protein